ncbi:MAG: Rieske 2Fe-2S domain-containing protein [Bryobacterales bacterium]|jgi:DMSO/TMAO reductase YedYZ heme-binding membrane subunit/nitrite reductase/ring-hydroxylating ferredoxin subunit|nr:Rieske 2Fe-2S domain-containing protein [Bryobacterales bacterium]
MSIPFRLVQWNDRKLLFDGVLLLGIALYLALFAFVSVLFGPRPDVMELGAIAVRAFGSLALLMLHVVLAIGPLARLHPGFLPVLVNRRHLGVATFLVACAHGLLATLVYHAHGALNPLASILLGNGQILSPRELPFEVFGLAALLVLAALAFTSHDFWIACLGLVRWKRLHLLAYAAYCLLLLHVALGSLQSAANPVPALLLACGAAALLTLHIRVARAEQAKDQEQRPLAPDGWIAVCRPEEIPENRAVIVSTPQERVAVFRHWQGVSAVSNVCAHQGGPLGEGVVEAGCIRCPWHGALYFPHNGTSPPPYPKAVATYNLRLVDGLLYLNPQPNPTGAAVDPVARPVRRGAQAANRQQAVQSQPATLPAPPGQSTPSSRAAADTEDA